MKTKSSYFEQWLVPVTGCSEPAACGLAVAIAAQVASGRLPDWLTKSTAVQRPLRHFKIPQRILLVVDRNTYKNGYDVAIPGTRGEKGLALAAALGIFCDAQQRLNLFRRIRASDLAQAKRLLAQGRVQVQMEKARRRTAPELSIRACLCYGGAGGGSSECQLRGEHERVVWIRLDKRTVFRETGGRPHADGGRVSIQGLKEIYRRVRQLQEADRRYLRQAVRIQRRVYCAGVAHPVGMAVGYTLLREMKRRRCGAADLFTEVKGKTAAACDVRMSGEAQEVMASSGSGNQGIIATVPLLAVHERLKKSEKRLLEALAVSHLWTAYASSRIGPLSPLCGCAIKAGLGAAAGIAYYLDGCPMSVQGAIQNMAGNITGEICDGAKTGCAMKLATAASAALQSALLACKGVVIPTRSGIIGHSADETMGNIARLAHCMGRADTEILRILHRKQDCTL